MKPNSYENISRHLLARAKPLHATELHKINRRVIAELLAKIETASGPVARNRVRASLSAFFAWCIKEGLCESNPVSGTGKADEGGSRERVLTKAELAMLWHALIAGDNYSDVVRLLLLTGQRREEIAGLRWSEVDFDAKLIRLGAARTKNSREHLVPLSKPALEILSAKHRNSGSIRENDSRVFRRFSWARKKDRFDAALGIKPYRIHDLRRSVATGMADLGILPHHIESILNHVSGHKAGVAGIYNRAKYHDEMRDALDRWADYLTNLTGA
jgi:integrase